jgi:hypothetical protein
MPADAGLRAAAASAILDELAGWARRRADVLALALVGSWARGAARPDSDIDLVILTERPRYFRENTDWLAEIGWNSLGLRVAGWDDADYGDLWSRHVRLDSRGSPGLPPPVPTVEFGFALPAWASVEPVDAGTFQVIHDGCRILFDPRGLLARLAQAVQAGAPGRP